MKYYKPGFHFISATNVEAECVSGSGAAHDGTCTTGPIVLAVPCQFGSVAIGNCSTGTCADNCVSVGGDVGAVCCAGTSPV